MRKHVNREVSCSLSALQAICRSRKSQDGTERTPMAAGGPPDAAEEVSTESRVAFPEGRVSSTEA